jgi:hypothetical protein
MAHTPPNQDPRPAQQRYRVMLRRGPDHWTFTFSGGDEAAILRRVAELARDPDCPLDWYDANAVREQIDRLVVHSGGPVTDADTSGRAA